MFLNDYFLHFFGGQSFYTQRGGYQILRDGLERRRLGVDQIIRPDGYYSAAQRAGRQPGTGGCFHALDSR